MKACKNILALLMAIAMLAGDFDVTEVIPYDYAQMATDAGLVCTKLPSDQKTWIYFNTKGISNLTAKESTDYNAFINNPSNNWDCYFGWTATATSPGLLSDSIVYNNYKSERVEQIREAMWKLDPKSEEYMALWEEWSTLWDEECQVAYMAAIDWWWHPATLHINDDGENGNDARYFYNSFWEDPVNHEM